MSVSPASRDEVVRLIDDSVANVNLRRHMLATEAVMRGLAVRLGHDPDVWGLAGLAHDLDAEETEGEMSRHGARAAERLADLGLPDELTHAVAAHNPATAMRPSTPRHMSKGLPPRCGRCRVTEPVVGDELGDVGDSRATTTSSRVGW